MSEVLIERAHRVGPPSEGTEQNANNHRVARRSRHILFKVQNYNDKIQILKQKRQRIGREKYFITVDQTDEDMAAKQRLQLMFEIAKQENKKWRFTQGKLFIEGQLYRSSPEETHSSTH